MAGGNAPSNGKTKGKAIGNILIVVAIIAAVIYFTGVSDGVVNPDVRVTYRGSYLNSSYVFAIVNAGSKPLFDVTVGCDNWSKRYIVSHQLNPGDTVEAGWIELPEGIKSNQTYYISADGYAGSVKASINK